MRIGHRRTSSARRNAGARLHDRLSEIAWRIREHLEPDQVLVATIRELEALLPDLHARIWLADDGGAPPDDLPPSVAQVFRTGKPIVNDVAGSVAVPLRSPRASMLGVLHLGGKIPSMNEQLFVEAVARETGLAIEAARHYQHAILEREKTRAILANVGDAVIVTDARGTITDWNQGAERTIGIRATRAEGRTCSAVLGLTEGNAPLDCAQGCPLLAANERRFSTQVERQGESGRRQSLLATVTTTRDSAEVIHSFTDITRLKEAEEAKTMFLATASHELRTPLTVIQGFTQTLLQRGGDEDFQAEALEAIERRALELASVVDRLLLTSRIESGRVQVACAPMDVLPVLHERTSSFTIGRSHDVILEPASDVARAVTDPEALTTVVDHLLDNAAKYSDDSEPIRVSVYAAGAELVIAVRDGGIGMTADEIEQSTQKFWQAERSSTRRFGGSGIGLYIVRSLVEGMRGRLTIESEVGVGSTFAIHLPLEGAAAEHAPDDAPAPEPDPIQPEPSMIREAMRVAGIPLRRSG